MVAFVVLWKQNLPANVQIVMTEVKKLVTGEFVDKKVIMEPLFGDEESADYKAENYYSKIGLGLTVGGVLLFLLIVAVVTERVFFKYSVKK
jgi:hypothetical protein